MEPIQYWNFLRRWWKFVVVLTVLGLVAGFGILRLRSSTSITYTSSVSVVVNYITPAGVPYNPTFSPRSEVAILTERGHNVGFQQGVARRVGVPWSTVTGLNMEVDPTLPLITLHVSGTTPQVGHLSRGLADALATIEIQRVLAEEQTLRARWRTDMLQAETRWVNALTAYNEATVRSAPIGILARLEATASVRQEDYVTVRSEYQAVDVNPVPPATTQGWTVSGPIATHTSATRILLPAALLGLLFGIGFAALLDYYGFWILVRRAAMWGQRGQPGTRPRPVVPATSLRRAEKRQESSG